MIKRYKKNLSFFLDNKIYIILLTVIAIICYGFSASNLSIGIDDLEGDRYVGSGNDMLCAGRFGMVFWAKILGYGTKGHYTAFALDVISVVLLIWALTNFCILFQMISGGTIPMPAYTVFSCAAIGYPLNNEIWEYTGANILIGSGFLLVSFALILIYEQIHERFSFKITMIAVLAMMIVCASYESLAVVYVFMVFAVLSLQVFFGSERHCKSIIRQGGCYAGVLAGGLIMRIQIHMLILLVCHFEYRPNGATGILWLENSLFMVCENLWKGVLSQYILKGIIYFPITELLFCMIIFFITGAILCKRIRCMLLMFPWIGMFGSLFLLSIIQGTVSPYRTCQVFAVFVSFSFMMLIYVAETCHIKYSRWLYVSLICVGGILCIRQAVYLNQFLMANYLRSEEEAYTIRNIGKTLKSEFCEDKYIIFTGDYKVSRSIIESVSIPEDSLRWRLYLKLYKCFIDDENYSRKLPETNVNSVIQWATTAFGTQESMHKLFSFYGFDYQYDDDFYWEIEKEAREFVAINHVPCYPQNGYIIDCGDYYIVNLGEE